MSVLFLAFAAAHLVLAAVVVRTWSRCTAGMQRAAAIVLGVAVALVFDNLVVGLGTTIGEGDLLANLNRLRFTLHVLVTPLVVLAAVLLGQAGGLDFTRRLTRPAQVLVVLLIVIGIVTDGLWPELEPVTASGVLRYVVPDPILPVPSIVAVVSAIVVGGALWKSDVTRWMLLGSAVMFLGSAVPPGTLPVIGNLAEVAFVAGLVATVGILAANETEPAPTPLLS